MHFLPFSGMSHIIGSVIRYLDFKKDEQELRLCLAEVEDRKQSAAWIHSLQKVRNCGMVVCCQ